MDLFCTANSGQTWTHPLNLTGLTVFTASKGNIAKIYLCSCSSDYTYFDMLNFGTNDLTPTDEGGGGQKFRITFDGFVTIFDDKFTG